MLVGMGYALIYFVATTAIVFMILFAEEQINPAYKLWEEVRRGNVAVGLTVSGKLIGLALIAMTAIQHNAAIVTSLVWIIFGAVLQVACYALFELMTPKLNVGRELAAGNRAVGVVSMGLLLGVSLVIAACIS